jgi:hypothetical protein
MKLVGKKLLMRLELRDFGESIKGWWFINRTEQLVSESTRVLIWRN